MKVILLWKYPKHQTPKPIKARDLKALREQKLLQQKSSSNKNALAIEIKRGVAQNYNKVGKMG